MSDRDVAIAYALVFLQVVLALLTLVALVVGCLGAEALKDFGVVKVTANVAPPHLVSGGRL